jgi:hypothetical protein
MQMSHILAAAALLAAILYLGAIHRAAARARHRHQGEARHVAARIFPPHHQPGEARRFWLWLGGLATDQPRALPFLAAILAGGAALLLALDPILADPILWGRLLPPGWRAALPDWLKLAWVLGVLALVLGHALWIFLRAPRHLSRHWLLLHPDGAITAQGAELPRIDPTRPRRCEDGITSRLQPDRRAEGAVLEQDGVVIGFVANPHAPGPGSLRPLAVTPPEWWRVELEPESDTVLTFLRRHHPPAA